MQKVRYQIARYDDIKVLVKVGAGATLAYLCPEVFVYPTLSLLLNPFMGLALLLYWSFVAWVCWQRITGRHVWHRF